MPAESHKSALMMAYSVIPRVGPAKKELLSIRLTLAMTFIIWQQRPDRVQMSMFPTVCGHDLNMKYIRHFQIYDTGIFQGVKSKMPRRKEIYEVEKTSTLKPPFRLHSINVNGFHRIS